MEKTIIMPGQFVTFENAIYKAKKCKYPEQACSKCDLYRKCPNELNFKCGMFVYFKYVETKHFPKTRRCKRVQKEEET